MTTSAMCDYCGKHENPIRMFKMTEPHSFHELHFCDVKCLKSYIEGEWCYKEKEDDKLSDREKEKLSIDEVLNRDV